MLGTKLKVAAGTSISACHAHVRSDLFVKLLFLGPVFTALLTGACSSDDDAPEAYSPPVTQSTSGATATDDATAEEIRYYDNNLFALGSFSATPESCDDQFARGEPESSLIYWDAVTPTSCYQEGAMPMTPPAFDCSNGVAPDAPGGQNAIAGDRIVFDIRTLEIKVTSHVIDICIPIGN